MVDPHPEWIIPQWPAPQSVRALVTTRAGGVSKGPYASLNLGDSVGDLPANVAQNRAHLAAVLPAQPRWLRQVHGSEVARAEDVTAPLPADASVATRADIVCAVLVADCLPVLMCDRAGTVVAAAHAGWRGLCAGVLENTVQQMGVPTSDLMAYLGPAIGAQAFEVGADVHHAFVQHSAEAASAFRPLREGKWLADLFALARQRLNSTGVNTISGGSDCTFSDPARFFSHRRDRVSGRMAALIWLANA